MVHPEAAAATNPLSALRADKSSVGAALADPHACDLGLGSGGLRFAR
jgi:hypothetical protein